MYSIVTPVNPTGGLVFDLTTAEAVNTELGIEGDTASNTITAAQITSASQLIASLCDRVFALQTVSQSFSVSWQENAKAIMLARYPVVELTSVTVDGSELSSDGFDLDYEAGILYRKLRDIGWHGEIVVEYSGGYNLPDDAPAPLALACIELIKQQRVSVNRDPAIRSIQDGDQSISYGTRGGNVDAAASISDIINQYKSRAV